MTRARSVLASVLLVALICGAKPLQVREVITGKVVSLADGDTLTVLDGANVQHKIRLWGIDAPERGQAFGTRSRENLAALCFGKPVRVEVVDVDRYRREVGRVYCGPVLANLAQVQAGMAWDYRQFDRGREFAAAEAEARAARRGLWVDPAPVPPWEFRRSKRTTAGAR